MLASTLATSYNLPVVTRRHLLRVYFAVAAALLLAPVHFVNAATFTVTSDADVGPGSLRQAVADALANAGDDIVAFDLPGPGPHVIDLLSAISISSNLQVLNGPVSGSAVESVTVQRSFASGTPDFSLFRVLNARTVVIAGLTLRNGRAMGPSGLGGAIFMGGAALTLRDCVISGNAATSGGALGIDAQQGNSGIASVKLVRCEFVENTGQFGGALYVLGQYGQVPLAAEQCVFRNNSATGDGGAVHLYAPNALVGAALTDCWLVGNNAAGGGGGLYVVTDGFGAGEAEVEMSRCTISGNSAGSGGGISFRLSRISANIENCTFSGNVAGSGGAIDNATGASVDLRNVTIAGNHASSSDGGGGVVSSFGLFVSNSIVAANTSAGGAPDTRGYCTSSGHNLIGRADGASGFVHGQNGDQVGTIAAPVEPRLGPLHNNGGLTQTRALLAGSPAIDAGNDATAPPLDQRGMPRRGVSDIGAYEFRPLPRAEITGDGQSDIIWQNNATGQRGIWEMNGLEWTGVRWLPVIPTEWQIATSGDFNSDGNIDLVWENTSTGVRGIWLMDAAQWVGERYLPTVALEWQIAGSGDFNGDGHTDLLWQNNVTGERGFWLMNGTDLVTVIFLPRVPTEWVIAAVDEFTGDGHLDILWQNLATGQVGIWAMNSTTSVSEHYLPTVTPEWRIAGSGDFNGDAHADIVWQNNVTGQRGFWLMNGMQSVGESFLPTVSLEWEMRNH